MGMTEEAKKFLELLRYMGEKNIGKRGKPPHIDTFGDLYLEDMFTKAADLIESLSEQLEQTENKLSELLYYVTGGRYSKTDYSTDDMRRFVDDYNQSTCDECDKCDELEQVTKERDAAVETLRDAACCADCKDHATQIDSEPCKTCLMCPSQSKPNWQWRGVEVTNDAQKGSDAKS